MSKKRVKKKVIKKISPVKYIIQKGRSLDFHECLINDDWQKSGMASVLISKKMPSGHFIIALYLIDIYCLGLKNVLHKFNVENAEYEEFVEMAYSRYNAVLKIDTVFAHNLIYGAIDYAEDLGFNPHKDFKLLEYLLDPDLISDEIDEIEFGKDGKPLFIEGPDDNAGQIIRKLKEAVGEGNFDHIAKGKDFE